MVSVEPTLPSSLYNQRKRKLIESPQRTSIKSNVLEVSPPKKARLARSRTRSSLPTIESTPPRKPRTLLLDSFTPKKTQIQLVTSPEPPPKKPRTLLVESFMPKKTQIRVVTSIPDLSEPPPQKPRTLLLDSSTPNDTQMQLVTSVPNLPEPPPRVSNINSDKIRTRRSFRRKDSLPIGNTNR
jgi:hypothetical protein